MQNKQIPDIKLKKLDEDVKKALEKVAKKYKLHVKYHGMKLNNPPHVPLLTVDAKFTTEEPLVF